MVLDRVSELENEEYMSMTQEERDSINEIFENAEGAAVFRYLY